jgi:hypothetical protein
MKTLAIRLEDDQHAQLVILSKLSGTSLTDAIRDAINAHLATLAADPEISAKAEEFTAAIDREAAEQRDAVTALFGSPKRTPRTRQTKD